MRGRALGARLIMVGAGLSVALSGCGGSPGGDSTVSTPAPAEGATAAATPGAAARPADAPSSAATATTETAPDLPAPPPNPHPAAVSGSAPTATDDVPPVIVLEPRQPYAYPEPSARPMMDQMATRFTPGAIVVRTGKPVDFRNDDSTLHNVRVRERGHGADDLAFNIALPQGVTYDFTFARDDAWDVRCDMHQNMYGLVVSTKSPYSAVTAADGTYRIDGVLPGEYLAIAYTSRARSEQPITLKAGQHLKLDFKSPS